MKIVFKILLVVSVFTALFLGFKEKTTEERETAVNNGLDSQDEFASYETQTIWIEGKEYEVYVADTEELRSSGLSGKSGLPEGFGMIFVFERPDIYGFWMKEMKFPLDIIWIQENTVVDIWKDAPIPSDGIIPSFTPNHQADRVLEFPAGFVGESGLLVGGSIGR